MTIRRAILWASLALVIGATLLSGAMSFYETRRSLQAEIARNLRISAAALLERLDAFFFERLEDLREWHRLELLQDIRVGDVDKRLARLLSDLKAGHGAVYSRLFCTDLDGRVVAASDGDYIGHKRLPGPVLLSESRGATAPVILERFAGGAPRSSDSLVMRTEIPNAFGDGELGYLYAVLNWREMGRSLSEAIRGSGRTALLLGADGAVIAAAGPLVRNGLPARINLADWYAGAARPQPDTREGTALGAGRLLVGAAASSGYQHFSGFGWHLLMVEPTSVAFAPVWRLAWVILGALLLTLALAGWLSMRLSQRIARPIGELTEFARRLRQTRSPAPPRIATGFSEVRELSRAFGEMIEALERSREHLIRAGKLAVVGEMAAIMAHEVRTPLGILKSSAQLLERRPDLSPQDRELTTFISSETDRLNRLVSTLLECATPRPPKFRLHDLHDILEHVVALVTTKAGKKAIEVRVHPSATEPVLSCDREQLIQVLLNLLINAIQIVPEGGHIDVHTENAAGGVSVRVEDDGPGIPESERERVFDPFFTRREGGIGLGLTIVEQIVQAHGGSIQVSAGRRGGACFTVRLRRQAGGALS